ncbi:MAG TPA: VIT domain-containing protein [Actinomycetes bacterium]|jgi:Ca-activated chloride channel family protein|nr:VIT domain-containing protein [Actinomycetes bacterium]
MTSRLPLLTDDEVAHDVPPGGETGIGTLTTRRGNLPLEALDVAADIAGLLARVVLTQTFSNPCPEPLEATYVFPLPDRAAVTEFRMEVAGRVVEGVLQERGQARAAYDQAVSEGRRASIAEEERPGVFTIRVGNLMPGERASIRLAMAGPLPYADGEATFRFPLVVAPRYVPGVPLPGQPAGDGTALDTDAVPDASRITPPVLLPGFPNPIRLSISAQVDPAGLPLTALRSSLHAVVEDERDGVRVVRIHPGERADRDFVLRLALGDGAVATSLAAVPDEQGEAGTFALTLVPPVAPATDRPRDVVFVLDRSGSMAGWKMVAARRAMARMVDTLTDRDRFAVLAFDNVVDSPDGSEDGLGLRAATDHNRFRAAEFLIRIDARGGTEMAGALQQALELLGAPLEGSRPEAHDRVLVLVTDGQVANEHQLLRLVAERIGEVRVFTVGIDTAVNAGFLRRLAGLGGGACELVESEDRLDAVMGRIHRRIGTPLLTELRVEGAGLHVDPGSLSPGRLPDLFAGVPVVIGGRWRGRPEGAVTVRGREPSGRPWQAEVRAGRGGSRALAPVWARARLRDLEDAWVAGRADDQDLERQIVETSLRFGVLCRFTAFVAVDSVVVSEGGWVRRVIQPVDAPQGWAMFAGQAGVPAPAPMMARTARTPGLLAASAEMAPAAGRAAWQAMSPAVHRWRAGTAAEDDAQLGEAVQHAYRRRALDLHTLLAGTGTGRAERAERLAELQAGLSALVADLESVAAATTKLRPLRELLAELERVVAGPAPAGAEAELERLWDRALAVLEAFARPAGARRTRAAQARSPEPGRTAEQERAERARDFWKRRPV